MAEVATTPRTDSMQQWERADRAPFPRDGHGLAGAQAQPFDSGVWVEIEFLAKHEAHLRYDWFGYRGHPLGSGAVESAIRRSGLPFQNQCMKCMRPNASF